MRLIKVSASSVRIKLRCEKCGAIHQESDMYADLDGKPFVDYFCRDCVTVDKSGTLIKREV